LQVGLSERRKPKETKGRLLREWDLERLNIRKAIHSERDETRDLEV